MARSATTRTRRPAAAPPTALSKVPTGVRGLDELLEGGLPAQRTTLVCGGAGCGKTVFALEFLVRGIVEHGDPGVFVALEEAPDELAQNVRSLGFDLGDLVRRNRLRIDHVRLDPRTLTEAGDYDLEPLLIRLGHAIDEVGARRVVIDTIETLFAGLPNEAVLRAELRRLHRWLKDRGVTAVMTAERGDGTLTRYGLEEYVSDCVILLDHRIREHVSTRRLRVVKYRGTVHGTNEYPFVIGPRGLEVAPITSLLLEHPASDERVPTGVTELDAMLGGGYYRGSCVLVSGTGGTGKSSLAAHLVMAATARGQRSLYFSFEESPNQILRNMRSIGQDLGPGLARGLVRIHASRPLLRGLEMHLATIHQAIDEHAPAVVVLDPVSDFTAVGTVGEAKAMLLRLVDLLKARSVTTLLTSLNSAAGDRPEYTDVGISSIIDTWILLRDLELNGERNRGIYVLKSRGMAHSNQIREFLIARDGIRLVPAYLGTGGVLTGSARVAQQARERAEAQARALEAERHRAAFERRRAVLVAQIEALRAELEGERLEFERAMARARQEDVESQATEAAMAVSRRTRANATVTAPADPPPGAPPSRRARRARS